MHTGLSTALLVIHMLVTLALIGVVLIQRSEGGGLGIGSSQGMGGFMTGRGTANLLTRTTAILSTIFMLLSLTLALMNRGTAGVGRSLLDTPPTTSQSAPSGLPVAPTPLTGGTTAPATPAPNGTAPTGTAPTGTAPADAPATSRVPTN